MNTEKQEAIIAMRNNAGKIIRRRWEDSDDELLRRQFTAGTGISEIAIILNRSERATAGRINKLGLYPTRPSSKKEPAHRHYSVKDNIAVVDTTKIWKI